MANIPKSKTRLYGVYSSMKQRCYNKNSPSYKYYGAKGITICDEWLQDFDSFRAWALENGFIEDISPTGKNRCTIDRIDPTKGYSPDNCRWISDAENSARAALARGEKSWLRAFLKSHNTLYEWGVNSVVDARIKELNAVITMLGSLSTTELKHFKKLIRYYLDARENGWNPEKYFEHGMEPYK